MMEEVAMRQRLKPYAGVPALIWAGYWIAMGLSSVHERMTPRTGQEEYGWKVAFGLAAIVGFATLFGYLWGKERREP